MSVSANHRILALQLEVDRLKKQLEEEKGRYGIIYVSWKLTGQGSDEYQQGWDCWDRIQRLTVALKNAYDLLHDAEADAAKPTYPRKKK